MVKNRSVPETEIKIATTKKKKKKIESSSGQSAIRPREKSWFSMNHLTHVHVTQLFATGMKHVKFLSRMKIKKKKKQKRNWRKTEWKGKRQNKEIHIVAFTASSKRQWNLSTIIILREAFNETEASSHDSLLLRTNSLLTSFFSGKRKILLGKRPRLTSVKKKKKKENAVFSTSRLA